MTEIKTRASSESIIETCKDAIDHYKGIELSKAEANELIKSIRIVLGEAPLKSS